MTLTVRESMHECITYISKVHFAYISLREIFSSVWLICNLRERGF